MTTSSPFLCSKWLLHASQRVEDLQDLSVPIWGGQSGKLYTVLSAQTFRFQSIWKKHIKVRCYSTARSCACHVDQLPESSKQPETMSNRAHPAYSAGDVLTRPWQNANVDTWICECFQNSYSMPFIHNRGHNKVVPKRTSNPMVIWVGTWGESLRRGSKTFEVKEIRVAVVSPWECSKRAPYVTPVLFIPFSGRMSSEFVSFGPWRIQDNHIWDSDCIMIRGPVHSFALLSLVFVCVVDRLHCSCILPGICHSYTLPSSTAQGGGGSFKNRKPIGEIGCCESGMAERSHWWTERCLRSPLFLSHSLTIYLPTNLSSMYLSIYRSISLSLFHLITYLSIYLSIYLSLSLSFSSFYLSFCLSVYLSNLSIYLSICLSVYLSICLPVYLSICGAASFSVV